jgi:hypothetical protein
MRNESHLLLPTVDSLMGFVPHPTLPTVNTINRQPIGRALAEPRPPSDQLVHERPFFQNADTVGHVFELVIKGQIFQNPEVKDALGCV